MLSRNWRATACPDPEIRTPHTFRVAGFSRSRRWSTLAVRAVTAADAIKACAAIGCIVTHEQIRQWAARGQIKKLGPAERGNAMRYDLIGIFARVLPAPEDAA